MARLMPAWILGWAALLAWGLWTGPFPWWLPLAALAVNMLTFAAYAADKGAARRGHWRLPEKNLHLLGLAGGWPGAWCAQQALRHKSRKAGFLAVYRLTVVLHCGALAGWLLCDMGQRLFTLF